MPITRPWGTRLMLLMLLAVMALAAVTDAAAQQQSRSAYSNDATHSLVVHDGTVWIDGEVVPLDELPGGLDLRGVTTRVEVAGDGHTTFDLGGQTFAFSGGRLVSVEQASQQAEVSVYFRQHGETVPAAEAVRSASSPPPFSAAGVAYSRDAVAADVMRQTQALEAQMEELVGSDIARLRREQLARQMELLHRQAASLVEATSRLPEAEMQTYFDALRKQDAGLFQQLQREWELEAATHQLASEIRHTRDLDRRRRLNEELRHRLDRVFELKQQNRRREIEQLERELAVLQERLAERERLRDQIVQRRVEELTGQDGQ